MPLEKVPSKLVPKAPPPGSLPFPHRVSDNESFETVAAKYGFTALEIILHNYGTSDPKEVNWYLREYVGCKVTTQDRFNWRFSSSADPGLIFIPERLSPPVAAALKLVDEFSKRTSPGAFIHFHRATIASQLAARVRNPTLINQGQVGLCPSAAVVYSVARSNPSEYVKAVTGLFEVGQARIGKWDLKPCEDLRVYKVPAEAAIPEADWIIMSSIRDSENWFFDYQSVTDSSGAWGGEVAAWLRKAGYSDVQEDWNSMMNKNAAHLKKADALYAKGYQVCLLIDADLILAKTATLSRPNHWVVLASKIKTNFLLPTSNVSMTIFTWGGTRTLPDRFMQLDDFIDYYYGYVAAKY